jgi:hypothetical protein
MIALTSTPFYFRMDPLLNVLILIIFWKLFLHLLLLLRLLYYQVGFRGGANATLFLENMSKPRHGKLYVNTDQNWVFCPGNSSDTAQGIPLPDLQANCQHLLDTGQLF